MLSVILPAVIGALLGAGLGYFGQCSSGTCPLTSTWWRGALYGATLGAVFGLMSGRNDSSSGRTAVVDSTNVLHFAQSDFEARVRQSEQPVLVDFYATWCGPCKVLAPTVAKLADEYAGRVKVGKVNVDEAPELAARFGIESIPTLLFFHRGKVTDSIVGLVSERDLRAKLQTLAPTPHPTAGQRENK